VASLLADLHPDGSWVTSADTWTRYSGPGWRLTAAVAWGADPRDPRLQAAVDRLLETVTGEGGIAPHPGAHPSPWLTARTVRMVAEIGWVRHPRCQEGLAWLEEPTTSWGSREAERAVTAVATLAALAAEPGLRRPPLERRAVDALLEVLSPGGRGALRRLGHPNLGRTDLAEILWALAMAGVPASPALRGSLRRLQDLQRSDGRWRRTAAVPATLPLEPACRPRTGEESRWITLRATVALLHYAVEVGLPRLFPTKPFG
jgi:hypothetical protein